METASRRLKMIADAVLPAPALPTTGLLRALVERVLDAYDQAKQRRALADLDDRLLRDVGLTRAQAARMSERNWLTSVRNTSP